MSDKSISANNIDISDRKGNIRCDTDIRDSRAGISSERATLPRYDVRTRCRELLVLFV